METTRECSWCRRLYDADAHDDCPVCSSPAEGCVDCGAHDAPMRWSDGPRCCDCSSAHSRAWQRALALDTAFPTEEV